MSSNGDESLIVTAGDPTQVSELAPKRNPLRALGVGAALVAVPVGGMYLYLKTKDASAARDRALENSYKYDVSRFQHVDPALVKFKPAGRIDTGLKAPRAIALTGAGHLLVAGDRVVRQMGTNGAVVKDIALDAAPYCVAVAGDGTVYVGLKGHVEVFSAEGKKLAAWPALGKDAYLSGIAVSGEHVYIADSGRRVVVRADKAGKVLGEIGRADPGRGLEGLLLPSPHLDVAVAADGSIWLNDTGRHRLENYAADGTLERWWGVGGTAIEKFPGCCNPTDFVLLKDGKFLTAEKGVARIKRYLPDGRLDCVVAPPAAFGENMTGLDLVVDAKGNVLALERGTSVVHVFSESAGTAGADEAGLRGQVARATEGGGS